MENLRSYFSLKSGTYLFYCTLILLGSVNVLHSIEIRRLSVPRWVQNGTEDYVVLDCDYTYDENDLRIVVKWFFQNDVKPFYTWIPDLNMRLVGSVVVNRPDLSFEVNTTDAYSRFRAVKLKPSIEFSGKYTCEVTSMANRDSKEQFMTVFVPANEFELSYRELSDSSVNVTCEAIGLFPKPVLKLYLALSNGSARQEVSDVITVSISKPSRVYDAYLYRTFNASELSKNGASVFECLVELPGTNYSKAKRIEYYPVPANEFELSYRELSDSSVNVTCEAIGLFPKPVLKLYLALSNGSARQEVSDVITVSISKPSRVYDAYLYRTFNASELSKNGASVFECLVELPGTNYSKAKRIEYYPDALHELSSASHTTGLSWLPLAWSVKLAYIWNFLWH